MKQNQPTKAAPSSSQGFMRQLGMPLGILLLMLAGSRYAVDYWPIIETHIAQMGTTGYALFFTVFLLLATLCFPVSIMGVSAGFLFGPWLGFLLVAVADYCAGLLMFGLGRTFLRDRIKKLLQTRPKLAAVDRMAGRKAYRLNLLTRLSPLNYGLACYTLAAGRTSLRAYSVGLLGVIPSIIFQITFGVLAKQSGKALLAGDKGSLWPALMLGLGLVFFLALSIFVGKMVKEAIDSEAEKQEPSTNTGQDVE